MVIFKPESAKNKIKFSIWLLSFYGYKEWLALGEEKRRDP